MILLADREGPDQPARGAGWSGPSLSAYVHRHVFAWLGPNDQSYYPTDNTFWYFFFISRHRLVYKTLPINPRFQLCFRLRSRKESRKSFFMKVTRPTGTMSRVKTLTVLGLHSTGERASDGITRDRKFESNLGHIMFVDFWSLNDNTSADSRRAVNQLLAELCAQNQHYENTPIQIQ